MYIHTVVGEIKDNIFIVSKRIKINVCVSNKWKIKKRNMTPTSPILLQKSILYLNVTLNHKIKICL